MDSNENDGVVQRSTRTLYVTDSVRVKCYCCRMSLADGNAHGAPVRQRSTRDRPAKAPLSVGAIVDAALAILKSDGLEAVTMRRVAAALDTGAASLYVYVSGREGLQLAMLDRVTDRGHARDAGPFSLA